MKTVLITGAGRGIGLALTKEFTQNGCQVIGTYRDENSAAELLTMKNVTAVKADVTDENSLKNLESALAKFTIDILINNAGVIGDKAPGLKELNVKKVAEVLEVNTLGPMRITQLALPFLKSNSTVAHIYYR